VAVGLWVATLGLGCGSTGENDPAVPDGSSDAARPDGKEAGSPDNNAAPTDGATDAPSERTVSDSMRPADANPSDENMVSDAFTGPSSFGTPCNADGDCAAGLLCLTADHDIWLGGGIAHGYCSFDCTNDFRICSAFGADTECLTTFAMNEAYCFKTCTFGNASSDAKCRGRTDEACTELGSSLAACLPTCGADADCPVGRYCDFVSGVCLSAQPQGDGIGTTCDPFGPKTCASGCASIDNFRGVCSGYCVLGADETCGSLGNRDGGAGSTRCVAFSTRMSQGDDGICVQSCRCDSDCIHPDAHCDFTQEPGNPMGLCLFGEVDAGRTDAACGPRRETADTSPPTD
jgi:hypothetical protein